MSSSPEVKAIPLFGAALAVGTIAIFGANKQVKRNESPALKKPIEGTVTTIPKSNHIAHYELVSYRQSLDNDDSSKAKAESSSLIDSSVSEKSLLIKHRPEMLKGLGGVAGTGFSKSQVNEVKSHSYGGHFNGSHDFYVTTYGPPWSGIQGDGTTSTGIALAGQARYEIAVDPNVIPYGSLVTVWPNAMHWKGAFLAADTGGAIDGNHVDVYDWKDGGYSTFSTDGGRVEPYKGPKK
jgi:3D (Asp-Asp-Asp) domain-containing protein